MRTKPLVKLWAKMRAKPLVKLWVKLRGPRKLSPRFNSSMSSICLQLEIENGDELTEDFLYEEVHPKQHAHKQAFAKPKGPAGKRGHKRLIRATGERKQES